jgi:iron complex transport system substrate-binding protein
MKIKYFYLLIPLIFLTISCDVNQKIKEQPTAESNSTRVITLSPHLGEIMYELEAGDMLVGVSAYSKHPEAILKKPLIGDAFMLDLEQISLLRPDIILAWEDGTPSRIIDELRDLNYRVEVIRSSRLQDIPLALERVGSLIGKQAQASVIANNYLKKLIELQEANEDKDSIRVFFQIDERPLFTVGGSHYISELIHTCGGTNIFNDLSQLAPSVSVESVIIGDPEVILTSTSLKDKNKFETWLRWPNISANKLQNLYVIEADGLERPTTNLIEAALEICQHLEESRRKRIRSHALD